MKWLEKVKEYFSRKFVLAISTLLLGYKLVLDGKDIEGWAILVGVVLAFYNGSNVAEKMAEMRGFRRPRWRNNYDYSGRDSGQYYGPGFPEGQEREWDDGNSR